MAQRDPAQPSNPQRCGRACSCWGCCSPRIKGRGEGRPPSKEGDVPRLNTHCSSGVMFEWPNKGHVRFSPQGVPHWLAQEMLWAPKILSRGCANPHRLLSWPALLPCLIFPSGWLYGQAFLQAQQWRREGPPTAGAAGHWGTGRCELRPQSILIPSSSSGPRGPLKRSRSLVRKYTGLSESSHHL